MDEPQGTTPPRSVYFSRGRGFEYHGQMSIDPTGRVNFDGNPFGAFRRACNAESNRPLTLRRVRMVVEDVEAE